MTQQMLNISSALVKKI